MRMPCTFRCEVSLPYHFFFGPDTAPPKYPKSTQWDLVSFYLIFQPPTFQKPFVRHEKHEKHGMSPLILQHHLLEELGFWVHEH